MSSLIPPPASCVWYKIARLGHPTKLPQRETVCLCPHAVVSDPLPLCPCIYRSLSVTLGSAPCPHAIVSDPRAAACCQVPCPGNLRGGAGVAGPGSHLCHQVRWGCVCGGAGIPVGRVHPPWASSTPGGEMSWEPRGVATAPRRPGAQSTPGGPQSRGQLPAVQPLQLGAHAGGRRPPRPARQVLWLRGNLCRDLHAARLRPRPAFPPRAPRRPAAPPPRRWQAPASVPDCARGSAGWCRRPAGRVKVRVGARKGAREVG